MLIRVLAAALWVAGPAVGGVPGAQVRQPTSHRDSMVIGGASMYEVRYGTAELRDIDEEMRPWPRRTSVRTVGRLFELRRAGGGVLGQAGQTIEWANALSTHLVCGRRYCLAVVPSEEMAAVFSTDARTWVGREVEIVGAIDDLNKDPRRDPLWSFLTWSISLQDEGGDAEKRPPASDLEALVMSPQAQAGERISVKGVFRGANLFEDMPPGSQRKAGDWVLKDGPFFIWVTGKAPKGSGFSLDVSSRADCRWRLEVSGKVETRAGLIYLNAKQVRVLGPARGEPPDL